jgi:UDP-N-acetyl-D-mannosaminuronic acid dehydrogenase
MKSPYDVAIVGLGYVGLTLAVSMAESGLRVWGSERQSDVVRQLNSGVPHIFEPGLAEAVRRNIGVNLFVSETLPDEAPPVVIIAVSTPAGEDHAPDLRNLIAASESIAQTLTPETLVIVRSTVPVGTTREIVLPILRKSVAEPLLACCPERTIQGQALKELRALPQVIGPLNDASHNRAVALWERCTDSVQLVESLEAAEMVKLVNNCHTDLLYAFGNEVALMAERFGIDPLDVIRGANLNYPRPNIARPGFVAGPCLTKDPYLLTSSFRNGHGPYEPRLVADARRLNEELPCHVADHFLRLLGALGADITGAKVLVCGFAYKGWPTTDDVRGSSTPAIMERLRQAPIEIHGHDFLVAPETIDAMGARPVGDIEQALSGATAVLFVNEHPEYRKLSIPQLAERMNKPALVYDCWRMFDAAEVRAIEGVRYAGIGYG